MTYLKRGVCSILAIVATASMQPASADVIDSYQPYVYTTGSTHTDIVAGADVSHFQAYDASSIAMSGGEISHFYAYNTSTINISGGLIGHMTLQDSVAVAISGGDFSHVTLKNAAAATVSGGELGFLRVHDDSAASIKGPLSLSYLIVSETSPVEIYATNTSFSNGRLSGTWLDGSPFEFWTLVGAAGGPGTIPATLPPNITIHSSTSAPKPSP